MGRGRIRKGFNDDVSGKEPRPEKSHNFSASSIPNADTRVFRELKAGVSKVESRIGLDLPQGNLGFSEKDGGYIGVHFGSGKTRTVLFDRTFYNRPAKEILADFKRYEESKFLVSTTTPLQATVIHELGHSIWVNRIEGQNRKLKELNKGIRRLYSLFRKDSAQGRIPISRYARKNINEFFAETFTKAIIGKKQNGYSRELLKLLQENKDLLKKIR